MYLGIYKFYKDPTKHRQSKLLGMTFWQALSDLDQLESL